MSWGQRTETGHVEQRREPIDLDRLQETAWTIVGAVLYLVGAVAGGVLLGQAFGAWVGALLLLVAGALPSAYTLRRASERRGESDRAAAFRATRETTSESPIPIPHLP